MNTPLLLKPKELCSIFGVKVKTIYAMLYRGDVPGAFQIGNSWYIDKHILLKELEKKASSKQKPAGQSTYPNSDRHGIGP